MGGDCTTVPIIIGSCLLDLSERIVNIVSSFFQQFSGGGHDGAHPMRARGGDCLRAGGSDHTIAEIQ